MWGGGGKGCVKSMECGGRVWVKGVQICGKSRTCVG